MKKFEHLFEVAVSVDADGNVNMRMLKDKDLVVTRSKFGPYEFELDTCEFEEYETILRKQRKAIKTLLKDKVLARKVKVRV